jgi:hypothetical protein
MKEKQKLRKKSLKIVKTMVGDINSYKNKIGKRLIPSLEDVSKNLVASISLLGECLKILTQFFQDQFCLDILRKPRPQPSPPVFRDAPTYEMATAGFTSSYMGLSGNVLESKGGACMTQAAYGVGVAEFVTQEEMVSNRPDLNPPRQSDAMSDSGEDDDEKEEKELSCQVAMVLVKDLLAEITSFLNECQKILRLGRQVHASADLINSLFEKLGEILERLEECVKVLKRFVPASHDSVEEEEGGGERGGGGGRGGGGREEEDGREEEEQQEEEGQRDLAQLSLSDAHSADSVKKSASIIGELSRRLTKELGAFLETIHEEQFRSYLRGTPEVRRALNSLLPSVEECWSISKIVSENGED